MAEYHPTPDERDYTRQSQDDEALLRVARQRFQRSEEDESELRREMLVDQEYRAGTGGWDTDVRNQRQIDRRPCLTINLIPGAIAQVTNEQRANRPSLRCSPAGGDATVEVARIYDGLLRHIQRDSRAPIAYDTAAAEAAAVGRGWMRVIAEYETPTSFHQKLTILSIPNAMSVFPQPNLREPDYSDMNWCFIVEDVPHDEFLARYPGYPPESIDVWAAGHASDPWITRDTVRVADYYYREMVARTVTLLSNGMVLDLEGERLEEALRFLPQGVVPIQARKAQVPHVCWVKLNGQQILERTEWLGSWIPVIPVLGDQFYVNGRQRLSGLIRDARDPQRMINYWESARTEAIALAPRAPWVLAEGQVEGYEDEWEQANTRNHSYLTYRPVSLGGTPVPPPQRNVQEPAIQALSIACADAKANFQATTHIYDASYGAPSNEKSGVAIRERDQNADRSNAHYIDNLGRSLHHLGRILVEVIPKYYNDPGRVLRIVHENGEEARITVNAPHVEERTGLQKFYDLSAGRYDVDVNTGPAYATQRKEAVAAMTELAKADPKIMQVADDLVVGTMDFPGAKDMAARLKKTIPSELLDKEGDVDKDTQLQQAVGQLQKTQAEAQALNAHAQQVEQALQASQRELQQLKSGQEEAMMSAQLKQQELAVKQEELLQKKAMDRDRMLLDMEKLQLEREKIKLELLRLNTVDGAARIDDLMGLLANMEQAQMQLQEAMLALEQREEAQHAARRGERTVRLTRQEDGTLAGAVYGPDGQILRALNLARTADGYHGQSA